VLLTSRTDTDPTRFISDTPKINNQRAYCFKKNAAAGGKFTGDLFCSAILTTASPSVNPHSLQKAAKFACESDHPVRMSEMVLSA
jgi:hypothetical protein